MKTISSELSAHLASEVTTLATCWKVTQTNGTVKGFTDHDSDLVVGSVTYMASTGFNPSAISHNADMALDHLDVAGMLDSASLTEADILAGLYDFAEIEIFQVNYADLTQGTLKLRRGWLGEVSVNKGRFVAEVQGLTQRLTKTIGELYSPSCRAELGDAKCTVNLTSFTDTGTVTAVTDNRRFEASGLSEAAGFFTFGKISFTSGLNNGLSMEVKAYEPGGIELALPMPYTVQVGDGFSIVAGCDKSFATCVQRFNNAVNFRGEPHVPGTVRLLETSTTRSE